MGVVTALLLAALLQDAVYADEEKGFSAAIPAGWSVTRGKDPARHLAMTAPDGRATCVIAVQPAMKAVSDGQVTLDAFLEEVKKGYPKKFTDFAFVGAEKGKDGDALTLDLTYTYTSAGRKIGQLQRLVWTKSAHFSIVFGCAAEGFDREKPDFDRHVRAFKAGPRKP